MLRKGKRVGRDCNVLTLYKYKYWVRSNRNIYRVISLLNFVGKLLVHVIFGRQHKLAERLYLESVLFQVGVLHD